MKRPEKLKLGMEVLDRNGDLNRVVAISRDQIAIEAYDYEADKWSGIWEYVTKFDVFEK